MPRDIKEVLSRLLAEMDRDDKDELLDGLKNKKLTPEELVEAIRGMSPESRAEVRELLAEVQEEMDDEDDKGIKDDDPKKKPKPKDDDSDDDDDDKDDDENRKTRPGRKSGRAYDWTVENGKVVHLDVARIYSGDDEPNEVEITADDDDEDES